jgi:hypothetical protein
MKASERDARLKLLMLQGAIYRGAITEARITLCEASKPFATARRMLGFLGFTLKHKKMALSCAVLALLLGTKCKM